jgi:hypothetical protein
MTQQFETPILANTPLEIAPEFAPGSASTLEQLSSAVPLRLRACLSMFGSYKPAQIRLSYATGD